MLLKLEILDKFRWSLRFSKKLEGLGENTITHLEINSERTTRKLYYISNSGVFKKIFGISWFTTLTFCLIERKKR